jgi:TM2 domain-containing membrane protein YozV
MATCIFILSVIVLNVAPIINGLLGKGTYYSNGEATSIGWYDTNCKLYNYNYNINKELSLEELDFTQEKKDEFIEYLKEGRNKCYRNKAMAGLEYAAFNVNVIFGLTCAILGLLKFYGNNLGKSVALIGIISGIIGFVLTFVYIIYSGIIFTQDVANKNYDDFDRIYDNALIKVDSESAHLK